MCGCADYSRKPACNVESRHVWLDAEAKRRRTSRHLHSGTGALRQSGDSGWGGRRITIECAACLPLHGNLPQQIGSRLGAGATGRGGHGGQPVGGQGAGDGEAEQGFSRGATKRAARSTNVPGEGRDGRSRFGVVYRAAAGSWPSRRGRYGDASCT